MTNYRILKHAGTGEIREIRQGFSALFLYLAPLFAFFIMKIFEFATGRIPPSGVLELLQEPMGDTSSKIAFLAAFAACILVGYLIGTRYNSWKERSLRARGYEVIGTQTRTLPELVTRASIGAMPVQQGAPYSFVRLDYVFAGLAFLVSFIVYLLTISPELGSGDSGELTTAIYNLGAAHPPGAPLYTMLGKIFTYLPIGSIAYRINLMAAFFAALTIFFFFLLIFRLLHRGQSETYAMRDRCIALTASFVVAFSLSMWEQAIMSEMYSLNSVFAPFLLLAVLIWQESVFSSLRLGRPSYAERYLLLIAILQGLALTNHLLLLGYIPPLLLLVLVVTQFVHEPDLSQSTASRQTANLLIFSLVALGGFLLAGVFGERANSLVRLLFALSALCGLGGACMLLVNWLKSMTARSRLSPKLQYACAAGMLGVFAFAALMVLVNAWNVPLLNDGDAARTIIAIFIPLITLGLVAIFLMGHLPDTAPLDGERKRRRLLFWGLGVWSVLFLLVIFEEGVFSILRIPLFFLPSAWFSGTAIRASLDFIGVGWGFDAIAFLVYILGATIAVFAYMRARKRTQIQERFVEMTTLLFKCSLFVLLPMLLYMTLVIRANAIVKIPDPPLSWGETVNASRVINHFLRKQYPKASMSFYNRVPEIADGWVKMHVEQYFPVASAKGDAWTAGDLLLSLPVFLCIVALGMWALWRRNRLWFWLLLACFLTFNVLLTTMISPKDTPRDWYFNDVFYVPSHLIVAIWLAFALQQIVIFIAGAIGKRKPRREEGGLLPAAGGASAGIPDQASVQISGGTDTSSEGGAQ